MRGGRAIPWPAPALTLEMLSRRLRIVTLGVVLCGLVGCAACDAPPSDLESGGVILEVVEPGGAAHRAGLEVGDRVVDWRRAEASASSRTSVVESDVPPVEAVALRTPVDLDWIEAMAVGPATLVVQRQGGRLEVTLPPDRWRVEARPALDGEELELYLEGRGLIADGRLLEGLNRWRSIISEHMPATSDRDAEASWLLDRISAEHQRAGDLETANAIHREAQEWAVGDPVLSAWLWRRRGDRARPADAVEAYSQALASAQLPDRWRARVSVDRCIAIFRSGRAESEGEDCDQAWTLVGKPAVVDPVAIESGIVLAKIARNRGRLAAAGDQLEGLRSAVVALDAGSRLHAGVLSELGIVSQHRGDLAGAQRWQRQALAIYEELGVGDQTLGQAHMGLGIVARDRGALAVAQEHFHHALAIFEREVPGTPFEAWSLQGLGLVAFSRGDYDTAERYLRRGKSVNEAAGAMFDVAQAASNLAAVAESRGDRRAAIEHYETALDLYLEHYPDSRTVARMLGNLGELQADANEFDAARELQDQAMAWYQEHAPDSISHADQILQRGRTEQRAGHLAAAEPLLQRALEIRQRLAPDSSQEALALYVLGLLRRDQGQTSDALQLFQQAIAALEAQKLRLGGSRQDAAAFAARFAPIYKDAMDLLLREERVEDAFYLLEQYRAQGLLAMLGRRDLLLADDVPAELTARRQELARTYEETQGQLAGLDARAEAGEIERLVTRLETLAQRRQAVAAEIVESSPRVGELTRPSILTGAQAAAALDPGTLLLSYVVLPDETYLFSLTPPSYERDGGVGAKRNWQARLQVVALGIGEEELRREIEAFLYLIRSPRSAASHASLERRGEELYRRLMAPVGERINGAERLLVVPDGPLHALPFGALITDAGDRPDRFLIAAKPLHTVVSLTVYRQLKERRQVVSKADRSARLVAFGDPRYQPPSRPGAPAASQAALRTRSLTPLPSTRAEVEAVVGLYPVSQAYLGDAATEARAKALSREARYLHFACHSAVDHRFPLDSYLALAQPASRDDLENGFLQAWEIFEQVRLDAELVTLSACETGLGEEVGGDGLVGLTRAFQYAGARSVLASLWGVSDQSTSVLMQRFYRYLRLGRAKDEALRLAQLDLLRGPVALPRLPRGLLGGARDFFRSLGSDEATVEPSVDGTHPFYWAAFQLHGDWR